MLYRGRSRGHGRSSRPQVQSQSGWRPWSQKLSMLWVRVAYPLWKKNWVSMYHLWVEPILTHWKGLGRVDGLDLSSNTPLPIFKYQFLITIYTVVLFTVYSQSTQFHLIFSCFATGSRFALVFWLLTLQVVTISHFLSEPKIQALGLYQFFLSCFLRRYNCVQDGAEERADNSPPAGESSRRPYFPNRRRRRRFALQGSRHRVHATH